MCMYKTWSIFSEPPDIPFQASCLLGYQNVAQGFTCAINRITEILWCDLVVKGLFSLFYDSLQSGKNIYSDP